MTHIETTAKRLAFFFVAVSALSAGSALAQANSAAANANANASIVTAIVLTNTAGLNFGDVVASSSSGTVVISPAGARGVGGGVTLGNTDGAAAAAFNATGVSGGAYAITLPASPITITDASSHTMTVGTFAGSKANGTLTSGSDTFTVGATLNVAANQVAGSYAGTFSVSVNLN
jgi:hypothetical protein